MATKIEASGINNLIASLESTRLAHAAGPTQTSTSLGTSFNGYQVTAGTQAKPVTITNIKSALTTLATSRYMNGTNYGTSIGTPTTGTLMYEALLNTTTSQVQAAAAICVHDASYYTSNRSSYDSGYNNNRTSYNNGHRSSDRSSYDASVLSSYRSTYNGGYCASYQDVKTSFRYNNSPDYSGNGTICTGN